MDVNGQAAEESSPLLGVVLCCTSIPPDQRGAMATVAQQMGASVKLDLTSDVTHLIVGNIDTPKYKYVAKERMDIKVLSPGWLEAVRSSWLEGGVTDVAALEEEYHLPTFFGLQICVTGFDDLQQRTEIQEAVMANGAKYQGDLTKQITHLVAAVPKGKKYEYAGQWGVKIVSIEWLSDSMKRGMGLDETLYHPLLPVEERGLGAVTRMEDRSPRLGKRTRTEDQNATTAISRKRKLRRTASSKLESQNDNIWADMGGEELSEIRAMEENWDEELTKEAHTEAVAPVKNSTPAMQETIPHPRETASAVDSKVRTSIFDQGAGSTSLYIHGFDARKTGILHSYLEANGANVIRRQDMFLRSDGDASCAIVVPHDISLADMKKFESEKYVLTVDEFVTDLWVERCLHNKRCEPTHFVLCRPLLHVPILEFEGLVICPTAFSGIDLLHFSKAVKLTGAIYDECLRPETSVLVCNAIIPNRAKMVYALQQGIPIVSASWLWTCIENGALEPLESYSVLNSSQARIRREVEPCVVVERQECEQSERERNTASKSSLDLPRRAPRARLEFQRMPSIKALQGKPIEEAQAQAGQDPPRLPSPRNSSLALQELDPVMNSPRKPSHSPSRHGKSRRPEEVPTPEVQVEESFLISLDQANATVNLDTENPPSPALSHQSNGLNNAIEHLLAQKRAAAAAASRTASTSSEPSTTANALRPRRKLGRATSDTGSVQATALSRVAALNVPLAGLIAEEESEEVIHHAQAEAYLFRPSQALSYEDAEGHAAREKLMKRMGLSTFGDDGLSDGMTKVESIGIIKSAERSATDTGGRRRMTRRR